MSEGAGAPRPEPTDADRLWVVDVVAPLPPGRVRLVAADAAARLNLPAEKLVPLLENRIGPVTKPLPLRSARRVAEVLNAAGAEVDMRTARASDGPPSAAREPAPGPPGGVERRGTGGADGAGAGAGGGPAGVGAEGVPPEEPAAARQAPEADAGDLDASPPTPARRRDDPPADDARADDSGAGASRAEGTRADDARRDDRRAGDGRPGDPWRAMREEDEPDDADGAMLGAWRRSDGPRSVRGDGASEAARGARGAAMPPAAPSDAPTPSSPAPDAAPGPTAPPTGRSLDDEATAAGAARGTDEDAGEHDRAAAPSATGGGRSAHDHRASSERSGPARATSGASVDASGEPGSGGRARGAGPGAGARTGTLGDEARASFAGGDLAGRDLDRDDTSVGAWPVPSAARGARGAGEASRAAPPPASAASGTVDAGTSSPGTAAPGAARRPPPPSDAASPEPVPARDVRDAPQPPSVAVREDDEDDEAYGFGFGMRDPFAEQERRDRAARRAVLAGALVVAVLVFAVLQWAYSKPGLAGAEPPPYAVGLAAYRDGAFVSAARAWIPRAEAGDARAMYMLGYMAEIGQGRPWSNAEAAGWYRQAADRGHAAAQLRLAALHLAGMGVARDEEEALRLTLAAAEAGLPSAQLEAARLLAAGGRHEEAFGWLRLAADREPEAAGWLGLADAVRGPNRSSE